jgi:hypothetical protein
MITSLASDSPSNRIKNTTERCVHLRRTSFAPGWMGKSIFYSDLTDFNPVIAVVAGSVAATGAFTMMT